MMTVPSSDRHMRPLQIQARETLRFSRFALLLWAPEPSMHYGVYTLRGLPEVMIWPSLAHFAGALGRKIAALAALTRTGSSGMFLLYWGTMMLQLELNYSLQLVLGSSLFERHT